METLPGSTLNLIKMQCGLRAARVGAKEALDNYQGVNRRLGRTKGLRRLPNRRMVFSRASLNRLCTFPSRLSRFPVFYAAKKQHMRRKAFSGFSLIVVWVDLFHDKTNFGLITARRRLPCLALVPGSTQSAPLLSGFGGPKGFGTS